MITIDSLTVRYGQKTVLDRLTMHLTEGAVHGLAGINGAGKTTLFETLFGLVRPAAGSITRFGRPLRRSQIAYMPAESFFYDGMTGRDLLEMTAHYHPGTDPEPWIDLFGLPADQPVGEWSAGMRRKLALAATLMQRKEVVLLDEPFNGLDMESLYVAQRLILRRRQEGGHDPHHVAPAPDAHARCGRHPPARRRAHRRRIPQRGVLPRRTRAGGPLPRPLYEPFSRQEDQLNASQAMKIIFATNNAHKLREVQAVLGEGFTLLTPRDCGITEEIPEEQPTLEGNALQKARYLHDRTGLDCFADDTGLEVEALGGAPGVHSARYATDGHDFAANNRLLLRNLEGAENRRARFRTVVALILGGEEHLFEGRVEGRIIEHETGHEGFGYDPLFCPEGSDRTFAQMTTDEKNALSHRARAVRKLADYLHSIGK